MLGSIISGVIAPSILSEPGVGPRLEPVSISSVTSLLGVSAGEGSAEVGVPGVEPSCCAGMLSRSPAVTAGWPGTRPPSPPICCIPAMELATEPWGWENRFCKPTICCGGSKPFDGAVC